MKTVGTMLKEARLAKGLTLAHVEHATKIREKFLIGIEADDVSGLPSLSYAKGFIRNYAQFVGLSPDLVMAFFRRQTSDISKSSVLPKGVSEPLNASTLQLTPGKFLGLLIGGLIVLFFLYFLSQYRRINAPPQLIVDQPKDQHIVSQQRVVAEGKTDPDATITINGISTIVRDDGRFYEQVPLVAGVNTIIIVATSKFGKTATATREVGYQP